MSLHYDDIVLQGVSANGFLIWISSMFGDISIRMISNNHTYTNKTSEILCQINHRSVILTAMHG